jgi:hypothetical protein
VIDCCTKEVIGWAVDDNYNPADHHRHSQGSP